VDSRCVADVASGATPVLDTRTSPEQVPEPVGLGKGWGDTLLPQMRKPSIAYKAMEWIISRES